MAEFLTLGAHVWDHKPDILDGGMTGEYAQYCLLHRAPRMYDPDEPAVPQGQLGGGRRRQRASSSGSEDSEDEESGGDSGDKGGDDGGRGGRGRGDRSDRVGRGGPRMRHTIVVQSADMAGPSVAAPSSPVAVGESSQMGILQGTVQDL